MDQEALAKSNAKTSLTNVRTSAEMEEEDDVVHDEESPRDPKKFILQSESEDDSIKLQEITNIMDDNDDKSNKDE